MSSVYYSLPGENLLAGITPTLVTGTLTSGSSLSKLTNGVIADALMLEGVDLELTWDLGSAVAAPFLFLFHTNLAGGTQAFRAHTTSTFTTPDISTAILDATLGGRGFYTQPYLDRQALAAKQFVNLQVTGNGAPIRIGGIWLASLVRTVTGLQFDPVRPRGGETVKYPTSHGVKLVYQRNTLQHAVTGQIITTRSVGLVAIDAWAEAAGWDAKPFPMVFESTVDHADFVRWNVKRIEPTYKGDTCSIPVAWEVESRGLPWVDPDAA
jgi:hypothetical protein